jgi:histone deacetylase complex regulatory component SIN3
MKFLPWRRRCIMKWDFSFGEEELFKRVYKVEEIAEDGVIVHIKVENQKLYVNEYAVEKVTEKIIRFTERIPGLGRQIPRSSIGYSEEPTLNGFDVKIQGMCISRDRDALMRTIARRVRKLVNEVTDKLNKQHTSIKKQYEDYLKYRESLNEENKLMPL